MNRASLLLICGGLWLTGCSQSTPTAPSAARPLVEISDASVTAGHWSTPSGESSPLPADEAAPPAVADPNTGCGICDPMNDSQLASLICETRQQIKYYETVLALRDADIALLTKGIREAESLTYRLLDKLIAWDKAYQLYLKGLGPNPERTLGSRDKYYTPWSEAAMQERTFELCSPASSRSERPRLPRSMRCGSISPDSNGISSNSATTSRSRNADGRERRCRRTPREATASISALGAARFANGII